MVPLTNPSSASAPPHYRCCTNTGEKKVILPLKILFSLNPANPGVKDQISTGKDQGF